MNLYVNCSPKLNKSSSYYFINKIKDENDDVINLYNMKYINLRKYETIIFSYPLYIDTIPSKLIEYLENIKNEYKGKNIYVISNCGFKESKHNELSTLVIKDFCKKKKANYKGALLIGSGPVIGRTNIFVKLLSIDFLIKIKKFKKSIKRKENISLYTELKPLNTKLYIKFGNKSFTNQIIKNHKKFEI